MATRSWRCSAAVSALRPSCTRSAGSRIRRNQAARRRDRSALLDQAALIESRHQLRPVPRDHQNDRLDYFADGDVTRDSAPLHGTDVILSSARATTTRLRCSRVARGKTRPPPERAKLKGSATRRSSLAVTHSRIVSLRGAQRRSNPSPNFVMLSDCEASLFSWMCDNSDPSQPLR